MNYFIILMYDKENERYGTTDILEELEMIEAVEEIIDYGYQFSIIDVKKLISFDVVDKFNWKKIKGV